MKANELRLGNLVYEGADIVKVAPVNIVDQRAAEIRGLNHLKPIKITKDKLIDLGFKRIGLSLRLDIGNYLELALYEMDFNNSNLTEYFVRLQTKRNSFIHISKFKFIHQIQNIYFELVREELEISKIIKNERI